ncbi:MAG: hypothetical protein U9Q04_04210 [Campylobacterota bacterium]|nr:hypothetical protein [Campylobacterota bacterium]
MSKKCIEEFNPWPPFVDIFSSTILVLLLFMLILVVNLGYYAQFKFRVSYTGTVATEQLILNDNPTVNKLNEIVTETSKTDTTIQETVMDKATKTIQAQISVRQKDGNATALFNLERAGQDLAQVDDQESTNQSFINIDDNLIINFADKEIILDDVTIKKIKTFIKGIKAKYPKHKIYVSAKDPKNQISATVGKQITLARSLNTRNLIRKLGYKKSDIRIRLFSKELIEKLPDHESGFVYIHVKVNK